MGKKIGIDLGASFVRVGYVDDVGRVRAIFLNEGYGYSMPSVVYFDPDNYQAVVGYEAQIEGALHPENFVTYIRHYLGDQSYIVNLNGKDYSPTYILSLILQKAMDNTEECLNGEEIDGAVITCPMYFGGTSVESILDACKNVKLHNGNELKVLSLLTEPTAIMFAYVNSQYGVVPNNVLIYDLGGRTFDTAMMKMMREGDEKSFKIITSNGDHQLGGIDWNNALRDFVLYQFGERTGIDVCDIWYDSNYIYEIDEKIEIAKRQLTHKNSTNLMISFRGYKEIIEITRETFDEITEHLMSRTISLITEMMKSSGLSVDNDIDKIILVGGASKMQQVTKRLECEFNKPVVLFNPEFAVAEGATLVANNK